MKSCCLALLKLIYIKLRVFIRLECVDASGLSATFIAATVTWIWREDRMMKGLHTIHCFILLRWTCLSILSFSLCNYLYLISVFCFFITKTNKHSVKEQIKISDDKNIISISSQLALTDRLFCPLAGWPWWGRSSWSCWLCWTSCK